jgi:hypothetical protein
MGDVDGDVNVISESPRSAAAEVMEGEELG